MRTATISQFALSAVFVLSVVASPIETRDGTCKPYCPDYPEKQFALVAGPDADFEDKNLWVCSYAANVDDSGEGDFKLCAYNGKTGKVISDTIESDDGCPATVEPCPATAN